MTGVIDVGGGVRAIYSDGVFDWCLDNGVKFDYCIGVSAGSANLASYLAGQRGRNFKFYTEYAFRREYMSAHNFLKTGSYVDLDYVYGTLSNSDGESPLDYDAMMASEAEFLVVAMNALTGEAKYFTKADMHKDDYYVMKASSCIPAVCKPYMADGMPYFDGGVIDPVPVKRALDDGCDKVVLLLTRPVDVPRVPGKDPVFARLIMKKYPRAAERILERYSRYNTSVAYARELEKQGRVLIIAPDSIAGMDTLTKDRDKIESLYKKGYDDAERIRAFMAQDNTHDSNK